MSVYRITKTQVKKMTYFVDAETEELAISCVDDGLAGTTASDVVYVENKYQSELMKFKSSLKLVRKEGPKA